MVEIAKEGQYSVEDNVIYKNGLGLEDLNTFTSCLRFSVIYLRPEWTSLLSYTSFYHDNTFYVGFEVRSNNRLLLTFWKYIGITNGIKAVGSETIHGAAQKSIHSIIKIPNLYPILLKIRVILPTHK